MQNKDIKIRRGERRSIKFGAPGDISRCAITFVVKKDSAITGSRIIEKDSRRRGEIEISFDEVSSKSAVTVNLFEEDTYALEEGIYLYDIDNTEAGTALAAGMFIVKADVQTPFDDTRLPDMDKYEYQYVDVWEGEAGDILITKEVDGKVQGTFIPLYELKQMLENIS